ncbi:MAG TPA: aminotransferase class III-fold pyridoxal phosphate-dependent enzyme, partial [Acidobacteriota bacterium]
HLHFQIVTDLLDRKGEFPGVAPPSRRSLWLGISPDPNLILKIPESEFPAPSRDREEILRQRQARLGPSLSVSYRRPLKIVRGYKQYLYDQDGQAYLDSVNNVPQVGHGHPRVVRAIQSQAAVLNTNTRYLHDNIMEYARRLGQTLPQPLGVFFFVNSGSEANDLALRLAWAHTGRREIIVVDGAYHGNLSSLIEISPYKFDGPGGKGVPPHVQKALLPDVYRGPFRRPDPEAGRKYARSVEEVIQGLRLQGLSPAAFIAESLMSCAGQIVLPEGYLRSVYQAVRAAGGVCIADEVQVGFGRVGTHFWGFETQGVVPDIVTLGKPMGNGHPLGAVITTPEIAASFRTGMEYFNTYGGNPVSCAAGLAVLDVIRDEGLQANALAVGNHLRAGLEKLKDRHPLLGDVRGLGLFLGLELVRDSRTLEPADAEASYIVERMRDKRVLASTDGIFRNVIKIKPPLVYAKDNADTFLEKLEEVLQEDVLNLP